MGGRLASLPEVYNKISMVDMAYVIMDHDRKNSGEKKAREFFENCRVPCEVIFVDGKRDFRGIVDAVRRIADRYKGRNDVRYSMNLTGGTSLMSSALCYSAFFIGAETYYVMFDSDKDKNDIPQDPLDERLVKLPVRNIPDVKKLGKTTRKVLDCIYGFYYPSDGAEVTGKILTHSALEELTGLSSSKIGYHLSVLSKKNVIITREKPENRNITEILVTEEGVMIKGWLDIV
ncbi:MAG: hypothetical protein IKQ93_08020 [Candidatus Methanomethylophilaceae archaeon]|nr:hypothetical protein [Candidatus Methanomethylophilaceae archaeon]